MSDRISYTARLARLRRDQGGAVAIIMALVIPILVGAVGLAVEVGMWYAERRSLQTAADAAAMGAAWELNIAGGNATAAATADAVRNGFSAAGGGSITVTTPPASGAYAGDASAVQVSLTEPQPLLFAGLFLAGPVTVTTTAVAQAGPPTAYCILALSASAASAVSVTGSAGVSLSGCGVHSNSNSSTALTVSGSGTLTTDYANTVGGQDVSGAGTLASTEAPRTGARTQSDPYADLELPTDPVGCTKSNYKPDDGETLSPGRYCGGLTINAGREVNLDPGIYIIDKGSLGVNGNATLTGTGVTIVLTGSSSDYASVDINGGAVVDLSAPTSGDYAGVVFYQDRDAPAGSDNKFNGGSTMEITGAMYFPSQDVKFNGGNSVGGGCTHIIASTVAFSGNSTLGNNCTGTGVSAYVPSPPTLVE